MAEFVQRSLLEPRDPRRNEEVEDGKSFPTKEQFQRRLGQEFHMYI